MSIASRPRSSTLILAGLLAAAAALLALVLPVSAQARPTDPPARPQGLTGDVTHDMVSLRWDDPGDDTVTSYQVFAPFARRRYVWRWPGRDRVLR